MRAPLAFPLALLAAAALTACGGGGTSQDLARLAPPEADRFGRRYLALIGAGQHDSALTHLAATMPRADSARPILARMQPLLAGHSLDTARIIGVQSNAFRHPSGLTVVRANLTYEMQVPDGWLLANVASFDSAGRRRVEGFSATRMGQSLSAQNRFTLAGKSALHHLWLVLTAASALIACGTAVFLLAQRGPPRRGWWALLALVGAGTLGLNWTTGAVHSQLLNVQLFGAGALRVGPAAPWVITFSFPMGALIALRRYRAWRRAADAPVDAVPMQDRVQAGAG